MYITHKLDDFLMNEKDRHLNYRYFVIYIFNYKFCNELLNLGLIVISTHCIQMFDCINFYIDNVFKYSLKL